MVERPGVQDLLDHHVLLVIPMAPQEDTHEDDDLDNWKVAMPLAFKAIREDAKQKNRRQGTVTCPCCTRTFANMARHMKTQHPDYNVVPMARKA